MGDVPADQLVVAPSALGGTAGVVRGAAAQIWSAAPLAGSAAAAGDPACTDALMVALRALGQTVRDEADGVDALAVALLRGEEAYSVADGSALPR